LVGWLVGWSVGLVGLSGLVGLVGWFGLVGLVGWFGLVGLVCWFGLVGWFGWFGWFGWLVWFGWFGWFSNWNSAVSIPTVMNSLSRPIEQEAITVLKACLLQPKNQLTHCCTDRLYSRSNS
jgi:hypothetical protein